MAWTRRAALTGLGSYPFVTAARRPVQDQTLAPGVSLTHFVSGETSIPTVVFRPRQANRPLSGAAVMLLHGGGGANIDVPRFYRHAVDYSEQGLVVAMPNYFAGVPGEGDVTRSMSQRFRTVIADGVRWLGTLPDVDAARLALMGYSRGGHLATEVAVTTGGVRAAVGIASAGGLSSSDVRHRPPVMLIFAEGDPVVRSRFTRRWAQTLRDAEVPVTLTELDLPRHIFEEAEWSSIFGSARRFLSQHLSA